LAPNTTYHFRMDAANTGGGAQGADMSFTTTSNTVAPPSVVTTNALGVTFNEASLNCVVNPNGSHTIAHFEYGLNTNYGNVTVWVDLSDGSSFVGLASGITGLIPSTTYHFRGVGSNVLGIVYGNDVTLITAAAPQPPTVFTTNATAVTFNSAILNGSVNPNGFDTHAYFQYGVNTNYGGTTTPYFVPAGTSFVGFSNLVSLASSTTYHFRAVAYNANGTSYGNDLSLSTPAAPGPPIVTTVSADHIFVNAATLHGHVDPNGAAATAWFEYVICGNTNYSRTFPTPIGTAAQNYSTNATSLNSGTTYCFHLVATNLYGIGYGTNLSFVTPVP